MNCKTQGLNQYLVEAIIGSKILELLNNGTLQAGLQSCDAACDTYLGKGTKVVTCDSLSDQLCEVINEGNSCLPFIEAFMLTGTQLSIVAGSETFTVDLASLFAGFTDVHVEAFSMVSATTLRLLQTNGTAFDVDLSSFITTPYDILHLITTDVYIQNAIASLFRTCTSDAHAVGNTIPTCAEMTTAINSAITAAIGGIAADKFLNVVGYNPTTHVLEFQVLNGSNFTVDLSTLVDPMAVSTDAGNTAVLGSDNKIFVPAPAPVVAPAPIRAFALNVAALVTPSGSVPRTNFDFISSIVDADYVTVSATADTITFPASTSPLIIELIPNASLTLVTGNPGIDFMVCLKNTVDGTEVAGVFAEGRTNDTAVQCTGVGVHTLQPGDANRTFKLTAITQAGGTWRVHGIFDSTPKFHLKITKAQ